LARHAALIRVIIDFDDTPIIFCALSAGLMMRFAAYAISPLRATIRLPLSRRTAGIYDGLHYI